MTTNQTHLSFALLILLAASITTYTAFEGKAADNASIESTTKSDAIALSQSMSSLIYHSKMVVSESLKVSKNSINLILDNTIETL